MIPFEIGDFMIVFLGHYVLVPLSNAFTKWERNFDAPFHLPHAFWDIMQALPINGFVQLLTFNRTHIVTAVRSTVVGIEVKLALYQ
jgi:hypothetical protein